MLKNILYNGSSIDWKTFCISKGKQCWILYVDALVLDYDGNLFDAVLFCTKTGIKIFNNKHYTTQSILKIIKKRIPKIIVLELEDGTTEIELSDNPNDFISIPTKNFPISITFAKINNDFIIDPNMEEESCISSKLTVAINSSGNICSIQKGGLNKGFSFIEIQKILKSAKNIGMDLIEKLDEKIEKDKSTNKTGFFKNF
jgi:exosome complex component RRP42